VIEKLFKLRENRTTVKTEVMAGITTFMTMAYILAVNPSILSAAGMDSTAVLLAAAAVYGAESMLLCLFLRWQENPQMLMSTPLLTVLFLQWCQSRSLPLDREKLSLFRTVSAGMYHVHPLFLAVFAIVLPGLGGLWSFLLCVICSAVFGSLLHYLKKYKLFALFC
jgi:hypothetical protein